jgi:hypothetical protein
MGDEVRPIDEKWLEALPKENTLPVDFEMPAAKAEQPAKQSRQQRRAAEKAASQRQPEPEPEAQGEDIDELRDLFS